MSLIPLRFDVEREIGDSEGHARDAEDVRAQVGEFLLHVDVRALHQRHHGDERGHAHGESEDRQRDTQFMRPDGVGGYGEIVGKRQHHGITQPPCTTSCPPESPIRPFRPAPPDPRRARPLISTAPDLILRAASLTESARPTLASSLSTRMPLSVRTPSGSGSGGHVGRSFVTPHHAREFVLGAARIRRPNGNRRQSGAPAPSCVHRIRLARADARSPPGCGRSAIRNIATSGRRKSASPCGTSLRRLR